MDIICNDVAHFERAKSFLPLKIQSKNHKGFCLALSGAEQEIAKLHKKHLKRRHKLWFKDANTADTISIAEQCRADWESTAARIALIEARVATAFYQYLTRKGNAIDFRMVLHAFTSDVQFHEHKPVRDWSITKTNLIVKDRSYTLPESGASLSYVDEKFFGFVRTKLSIGSSGIERSCTTYVMNRDSGVITASMLGTQKSLYALNESGQLTTVTPIKSLLNGYFPGGMVLAGSSFIRLTCGKDELRIYNPSTDKLVVISFAAHGKVGTTKVHLKWFCVPVADRLHLRVGNDLHLSIARAQLY
jgi:hypothetical protein